jgi:predicted ATP-grasp superfamily ATP-dependent carboligase
MVLTSLRAAVVTDGAWPKSLSAIRSLGKSGYHVAVMGDSLLTTGFWSRFTHCRVIAPTATRFPDRFGVALLGAIRRYSVRAVRPVVLPMEDASLLWIAGNLEKVTAHSDILIPPLEALHIALDKGESARVARQVGLPCPRAWEPADSLEFAKPEGPGLGAGILMDRDGKCVAAFAHERLHQYPDSGGPSTDRISIESPGLIEKSVAILERIGWRGVAMVEWELDPRDGQTKFLGINPRFWGSLELAVRAGIDFPVLYARAACGDKLHRAGSYPAGVRCRWEAWDRRDLRGFFATLICSVLLALNPRYWKHVRMGD